MEGKDRKRGASVDAPEERAHDLAESAAALLFELDEQGRTCHVGAGCTEILGYAPEELHELSLLDLVHPDERERVAADYGRVEERGTVLSEHRGLHKDGSWRWVQDTVRSYRTDSGERRFAVIGRDITAQKELEAALERQAAVQQEIAELSRHFLALDPMEIDTDLGARLELPARLARAGRTRLIVLEPGARGVRHMYSWAEPGAPLAVPRIEAGTLERFRWAVDALLRGETINAASPDALPPEAAAEAEEMRHLGIHGVLVIPIRLGETPIGYQVFTTFGPRPAWSTQEIAELRLVAEIFASAIQRKRAAEALEHRCLMEARVAALSQRFLGLAVDEIDAAVGAALAESAELAGAQRARLHSFGPERDGESRTYDWCAPGVEPAPSRAPEWLRKRFRGGEPIQVTDPDALPGELAAERHRLQKRGVRSLLGIPMLSGEGVIGFLSYECVEEKRLWSEHDVTALRMIGELFTAALRRRDAEEELVESRSQLLQAQKLEAVGRLAGGIAHDFNNLLTVILGFGRPLLDQLEPGPVRDDVAEIQAAAERAAALTKQLLTFSRRQNAATQCIELNGTVGRLESLLRPLLGEDVELLFELDPEAGWVEIDPHQLEQVVMNLAVNARDAMPEGGTLKLSTRQQEIRSGEASRLGLPSAGPHVVLTASDTGCGMDEETRAHLFDPFFTTKDPSRGTGLGLSIVYSVVGQAGGAITVSGAAAKGTTFEIFLPRVESGEAPVRAGVPAVNGGGNAHVLVVDDEASVRRVARRLLERAGHRVSEASDGQEALHLCTRGSDPPDLVLTDWVMPRLGGEELARRLRWLLPEARVLFMSGYPLERASEAEAGEPPAFLQKPFGAGELVAQVAEALTES